MRIGCVALILLTALSGPVGAVKLVDVKNVFVAKKDRPASAHKEITALINRNSTLKDMREHVRKRGTSLFEKATEIGTLSTILGLWGLKDSIMALEQGRESFAFLPTEVAVPGFLGLLAFGILDLTYGRHREKQLEQKTNLATLELAFKPNEFKKLPDYLQQELKAFEALVPKGQH